MVLLSTFMHIYLGIECKQSVDRQKTAVKKRWEEKRWASVVWRDYQLESAQRAYQSEIECIERDYEDERSKLKERIIGELLEERKRLMDELEPTLGSTGGVIVSISTSNIAANGNGKRMLRKRNQPMASEDQVIPNGRENGTQAKTVRRTNLSPYDQLGKMGVETKLTEEEIYEDINAIFKEDGRSARRRNRDTGRENREAPNSNPVPPPPQSPPEPIYSPSERKISGPKGPSAMITGVGDALIDAYVQDGLLHYAHSVLFSPGDAISVLVTQSDSSFTGTISTICSTELWIRREDGTKNKIYLGQLRIGKYKLSPLRD